LILRLLARIGNTHYAFHGNLRESMETLMGWIDWLWNDNVWSKVIAGLILAAILGAFKKPRAWALRTFITPKLTKTGDWTSEHPGATYPLKHYVEMKNDSWRMMHVRLSAYTPAAVTLKKFVFGGLTIQLGNEWCPPQHSVERIAVLPGQSCRAWLGVDTTKRR